MVVSWLRASMTWNEPPFNKTKVCWWCTTNLRARRAAWVSPIKGIKGPIGGKKKVYHIISINRTNHKKGRSESNVEIYFHPTY